MFDANFKADHRLQYTHKYKKLWGVSFFSNIKTTTLKLSNFVIIMSKKMKKKNTAKNWISLKSININMRSSVSIQFTTTIYVYVPKVWRCSQLEHSFSVFFWTIWSNRKKNHWLQTECVWWMSLLLVLVCFFVSNDHSILKNNSSLI